MTLALETRGLRKTYGKVTALQGLDLQVKRGEVFGFLGPNGAGKTTFTKCVTGFVRPDAGEVSIMGMEALSHPPRVAPHIGLVPDQYDFYPNLTGRQHLEFYGRLYGMNKDDRQNRIAEVLQLVRMEERADDRVKGYSHGMKQRICIAQAIMHRPDLIFFDEPTNGLDPKGAYELREMIRGLARDGTTVFLNSHGLHEVEQVCERVAILHRGQLRAVSRVDELRKRFATSNTVQVTLLNPAKKYATALAKVIPGNVQLDGATLSFDGDEKLVANAVSVLVQLGARIAAVVPSEGVSLESVFIQLTEEKPSWEVMA